MFFDQLLNAVYLFVVKAFVGLDANWAEPKISFVLISFDMDMGWFIAVSGVAEETIGANG
ncbi:MAG: hypothetical protein RLZZ597_2205 [Cyanobacteriota bacterium]|jgi:hypothetical protein